MRVLVVEDEPPLAGAIARGLRAEGMAVDIALDGADALAKTAVCRYEVIVLDHEHAHRASQKAGDLPGSPILPGPG